VVEGAGSAPEPIEVVVAAEEAGERLDRVLAARPIGASRSTIQRWIAERRVRVDGFVADRRTRAEAGAVVRIEPAPPPPSQAAPQDIPLDVRFEDDAVLVVNKPAGLVVHPAPGHADGTLVNALLFRSTVGGGGTGGGGELGGGGDPMRPGIVHRLDKDTSGIMVIARTDAAREHLVAQFQAHSIERRYLAIAAGFPPERVTYDTWIGRHPVHRKRFSSKVDRGKRAVTHVTVEERLHGAALVSCRLETGRTHQIRVHLADHGYPVLGDPLYGRPPRDPRLRAQAQALGRQALHAAVLGFTHPVTGQTVRVESELPADFAGAVAALRG
jgi:23S rRNA pseudouridine1911/1915/1917 synthase